MADYRIVMVEDSDDEAQTLSSHLARYAAETGVRFNVTRIKTAFEFVQADAQADLIFMDIDLPGINGMEAAQILRQSDQATPLIFVTNLAQYAVHGYQVDALDFMVKPVHYHDFAMRMRRAMRAMEKNSERTCALPTEEGMRVVPLRDIAYVELSKHDLFYHVADIEQPLRKRGSIRAAREELPSDLFITVSQGCLANMAHVAEVRSDSIVMDDGETLYFSRSRKRACMETLTKYLGGTI